MVDMDKKTDLFWRTNGLSTQQKGNHKKRKPWAQMFIGRAGEEKVGATVFPIRPGKPRVANDGFYLSGTYQSE